MKILILRNGETLGPFGEQEVLDKVESGALSEDDLAMTEGLKEWTPLGSIIVRYPEKSLFRGRVDHIAEVAEVTAKRILSNYRERPLIVGVVALLLGCLLLVLSQWPFLIYGPFLTAAIVAGFILLRRQQLLFGILILALTLILPAAILEKISQKQSKSFSNKTDISEAALSPMQAATPNTVFQLESTQLKTPAIAERTPEPQQIPALTRVPLAEEKQSASAATPKIGTLTTDARAGNQNTSNPDNPIDQQVAIQMAQAQVVRMYPDLGVKGSPLNPDFPNELPC